MRTSVACSAHSIGQSIPAVLIAFAAVTLLFAIIERATPMGAQSGGRVRASAASPGHRPQWTVDSLEDVPPGGASVRADAIVSLVLLVLLALVPFVPTTAVYVGGLNDGETFVNRIWVSSGSSGTGCCSRSPRSVRC